jgi:hypothetical protein
MRIFCPVLLLTLNHCHFVFRFAVYQAQREFNPFPFLEVLLVFIAQLAEIGRLQEKPEQLQPLGKLLLILIEQLAENPIILSFGLCLHAGIESRF